MQTDKQTELTDTEYDQKRREQYQGNYDGRFEGPRLVEELLSDGSSVWNVEVPAHTVYCRDMLRASNLIQELKLAESQSV